jgi:hypothetical protein
MSIIDDIRSKSPQVQNSQNILKAFGQESDSLEKGGKQKPEGSIYTRPDGRKFIKRGGKWVYHSETKGSVKIESPKSEESKNISLKEGSHYTMGSTKYTFRGKEKGGYHFWQWDNDKVIDNVLLNDNDIKQLKETTSKKESEKSEKDNEILKLLKEYKGKEAWNIIKKNGLFKGKWEQIPSDYNPNHKKWGVKLDDGSQLTLELPAYTTYKSAGKGSRLRDPSGTKYESRIKLIHKLGDRYLANEQLISFGYRGENDYKNQEYREKQEKYIKILNEATGLNLSRYSFSSI